MTKTDTAAVRTESVRPPEALPDEKLPVAGPSSERINSHSPSPEPGPQPAASGPEQSDDDDDEPEYDPDDQDFEFPISHELPMKDHTKVVTALAVDPSGARFVSGSHDYDCKLWDFGGMTSSTKPFKTWEPAGTYYVRSYFRAVILSLT